MSGNRLTSLTLAGYKSIREVKDLTFGDVNVLIGANGAGKSNLIGFFELLRNLAAGTLQEHVGRHGHARAFLHYGPKTTPGIAFSLDCDLGGEAVRFTCQLAYAAEDTLVSIHETMHIIDPNVSSTIQTFRQPELSLRRADPESPEGILTRTLSEIRPYQFHDTTDESRLRATCDPDDCRFLYADGANLPAMLFRLRREHRARYDRFLGTIRMVAPFIDDFVLVPMGNGRKHLSLRWRGQGREYEFGPHQLSDGTLRFIALTALLLQPAEWLPALVIIDEPELGLHPTALAALAELVHEAATDTQMLIATQSASLVDFFEPGEVMVAEREDGASVFRRLDEARLKEWLGEYSLGDLWRRNLIPGGPTHE